FYQSDPVGAGAGKGLHVYNETDAKYLLNILEGGNVGIGDINPTARLTVSGGVLINSAGYASNDVQMQGDTDSALFFLDASADMVGIGTLTPTTKLEVIGTMSGLVLHAQDLLTSSGGLIVEGATVLNSTLRLNGVTYTFPTSDGSASGKVLKTNSAGQLSWSTDNTGGAAGDPNVNYYVRAGGDTMTGGLLIHSTNDGSKTIDAGLLLEIAGTASGLVLHAQDLLTSSGGLIVEGTSTFNGAAVFGSTLRLNGTTYTFPTSDGSASGKVLKTNSAGQLSWSTDNTGGAAGDPNVNYYVRAGGDTMTGGLLIHSTNDGSKTVEAGVLLEVGGVMSGRTLFAQDKITSSGTLIIKSGTLTGSGAATILAAERQTGAFLYASGTDVLALNSYQGTQSGANAHIAFGYRGYFDVQMYRSGQAGSGELVLRTQNKRTGMNAFRIVSQQGSANNNVFRVTTDGQVRADGSVSGGGADYAEWFYSEGVLVQGELVCIDVTRDNAVRRCADPADGNLMGVVSSPEQAAFVGNAFWGIDGLQPPHYYLIGLLGQVAAKVTDENGSIRPGDSLTSASRDGFARRADSDDPTVGVALQEHESGEGTINVLIARRNSSLTVETVEQQVLETVAAMEIEDEVQILIADAVENLSLEQEISTEVQQQVENLDLLGAVHEILAAEAGSQISFSSGIWIEPVTFSAEATFAQRIRSTAEAVFEEHVQMLGSATVSGSFTALRGMKTSELATETLTVESGALVGGSLAVQKALLTQTLSVTSDMTVGGTLVATSLVADQAHVRGDLQIGGRLLLAGREVDLDKFVIGGSGSVVEIGELTVQSALFVLGDITIEGLAQFLGDVEVHGTLSVSGSLVVNRNQAGYAVIPVTGTGVTVVFNPPYAGVVPIVSASSEEPVLYGVSRATQSGFTIKLARPAERNITFSWLALVSEQPLTVTGATKADSLGTGEFPVDDLGYPLSSSDIWNKCIRNQAPLDITGQPFNCRRYHDDDLWTHPDLLVEFLWDPEAMTKLILPDGYTMVVVMEEHIVEENVEETEETEETEDVSGSGSTTTTQEQPPVLSPDEGSPAADKGGDSGSGSTTGGGDDTDEDTGSGSSAGDSTGSGSATDGGGDAGGEDESTTGDDSGENASQEESDATGDDSQQGQATESPEDAPGEAGAAEASSGLGE
ncbi:MAG TPA: hypothetical protein VJB10_04500, partial [Candidatus Peribacteraceae bacterium]|nr:hypothetical protein [Candidatus Peribacteraceae bacterium]